MRYKRFWKHLHEARLCSLVPRVTAAQETLAGFATNRGRLFDRCLWFQVFIWQPHQLVCVHASCPFHACSSYWGSWKLNMNGCGVTALPKDRTTTQANYAIVFCKIPIMLVPLQNKAHDTVDCEHKILGPWSLRHGQSCYSFVIFPLKWICGTSDAQDWLLAKFHLGAPDRSGALV